jgi:hypothetical protein
MCWSFLPHVRFLILLTVFELLLKTCDFTICSIFSNSGHVSWCTASPDTILELDTLVMIQTKFGFHWSSTFRGEDFWKSLRRRRTPSDGNSSHMTLWVRWAKNQYMNTYIYIYIYIYMSRITCTQWCCWVVLYHSYVHVKHITSIMVGLAFLVSTLLYQTHPRHIQNSAKSWESDRCPLHESKILSFQKVHWLYIL